MPKKSSESSSKGEEKKSSKSSKEKSEKSERSERSEKKHSSKDKDGSKSSESSGKHHHRSSSARKGKGQAEPQQPQQQQQRRIPPAALNRPQAAGGYMTALPSSSDESSDDEGPRRGGRQEEGTLATATIDAKEQKKRDRKAEMLAAQVAEAKKEAMRDDDDAFDVSYQGEGESMSSDAVSQARDIKVDNLTVRVKGKALFDGTSLTIAEKRRYGLVGPNGHGKSTLMRLIARRKIPVPDFIDVLLVEQEVAASEKSALEAVVESDVELMQLLEEEKRLSALTLDESLDDEKQKEATTSLNEVYDKLRLKNADSAEGRASKILHGLGFSNTPGRFSMHNSTQSFSGGWRMRVSLARALYIQPTLLLLDEPTNHLDLRAALWLTEYLQRWKKTLIVVSHDRDFLNDVTTDIVHVHDQQLQQYRGNFESFESSYLQRRTEANREYEKYQKALKQAKASGTSDKQKKLDRQQELKQNKQNKQQRKRGQDMGGDEDANQPRAPRKWNDYSVKFHFPEPTDIGSVPIQMNDVEFEYPGRTDFSMKKINLGIDTKSRIAIVGPNGAGKSTLLNLITGDLTPTAGESRRAHKLRIGTYSQHFVDKLTYDENPVSYLLGRFPESGLREAEMRGRLGRFGLPGHAHLQPINKLSGGQKARVVFTDIALSNPHILLLDEPTNNLDMESIDALADALEDFEGGVLIISHDARLISRVCDDEEVSEVWIVEDGTVKKYHGTFDEYKDELMDEIIKEQDEDDE